MVDAGIGGRRQRSLYFGVGLEHMRVAVAPSSERTYQGHFGAWVDFRVRCGVPVFSLALQRRFVQRVAVVRVCGVLFRYYEIALGHHREPFVSNQVFPSDFARFRA